VASLREPAEEKTSTTNNAITVLTPSRQSNSQSPRARALADPRLEQIGNSQRPELFGRLPRGRASRFDAGISSIRICPVFLHFPHKMNTAYLYVCVAEEDRVGVFREIHERAEDDCWIIAQIPASWGKQRATRLVKPSPDGDAVERPQSVLYPFSSQEDAIRVLEHWKKDPHA
jgi:hypothetical protein